MRKPDLPRKPNTTGWLWWVALLIAVIGGVIGYYQYHNAIDPTARAHMMLTAVFCTIGIGICIIAATSRFWMHR